MKIIVTKRLHTFYRNVHDLLKISLITFIVYTLSFKIRKILIVLYIREIVIFLKLNYKGKNNNPQRISRLNLLFSGSNFC